MAVKDKIPEKAKPNNVEGLELDCQIHGLLYRGKLKEGYYCKASVSFLELEGETPRFCSSHIEAFISKDCSRGYYKCSKNVL